MSKEKMKTWYDKHEIFDETLDALWSSFYNYKREHPAQFLDTFPLERDNVNLDFIKVAHEYTLPDCAEEHISVYVDIYTDDQYVGWFKQLFDLEGNQKENYFTIENEFNERTGS